MIGTGDIGSDRSGCCTDPSVIPSSVSSASVGSRGVNRPRSVFLARNLRRTRSQGHSCIPAAGLRRSVRISRGQAGGLSATLLPTADLQRDIFEHSYHIFATECLSTSLAPIQNSSYNLNEKSGSYSPGKTFTTCSSDSESEGTHKRPHHLDLTEPTTNLNLTSIGKTKGLITVG